MKNLLKKILDLCLQISANTNHAAFFDYAGHVNSIYIYVTINNENYTDRIFEKYCYTIDKFGVDSKKEAKEVIGSLTEILERGQNENKQ